MKKSVFSRISALLFCLIFFLSALSLRVFATEIDESKLNYYQVISKREWQLAPGITESEIVMNNAAGNKRQVSHVVEIDIHNPYTKVIPSTYKMAEGLKNKEYSTQIMSEQAKYAEEHGYGNVVAAMNTALHWYDTDYYEQHPELIGEPLGTLILDGDRYTNSQNSYFGAYTCIVINFDEKDGQPRPDNIPKIQVRQTYDAITGWEEQLIPASFHFLVKDGVNQHSVNDPEPFAPRTMMGVKADGTLVLVMVEGRQAPFSTGFNAYEMAEYMISLGCVQAINCDGGGSSTFLSERPGEELALHCSPSDGAERPVAHGVLVISTDPNSHEHVPGEVTDKEPTQTEPGYTGRVCCVECGIVMDEGKQIPATKHTYSVDVKNKKIICGCGCDFTETGLQTVGGKNYYTVNGILQSGWLTVDGEWYYFDKTSFAGSDGEAVADNGVKFVFDGGRMTEGVWVTNASGKRYWYGPGYYKDTSPESTSCKPCEIDGKLYLFDRNGYMQTGVVRCYQSNRFIYYRCAENGEAEVLSGVYQDQLYIDGVFVRNYRLIAWNGDFYFINDGHKIARNKTLYLGEKYVEGCTFADGTPIPVGSYQFDADGKMVIPKNDPPVTPEQPSADVKHGVIDEHLYLNGILQKAYQLVEFEGSFYFINDGQNRIAKNIRLYLSESFVKGKKFTDGREIQPGYYHFDSEGKMIIPGLKNGIIDDRLYINGIVQKAYQLVEFEGSFYFINDGKNRIAKNIRLYLSESFVKGKKFTDGREIQPGYYHFDSEGRMIIPGAKNGVIDDRLYINGILQKAYQLVEFEGSFYFINDGKNRIAKNIRLYLSESFVKGKKFTDGREIQPGYYHFDAEGKMIIPGAKNGVIDDRLYINGILQKAYQLVEFEGSFYFINDGQNRIAKNIRLYLSESFVKGKKFTDGREIQLGYYYFDADGKMILN